MDHVVCAVAVSDEYQPDEGELDPENNAYLVDAEAVCVAGSRGVGNFVHQDLAPDTRPLAVGGVASAAVREADEGLKRYKSFRHISFRIKTMAWIGRVIKEIFIDFSGLVRSKLLATTIDITAIDLQHIDSAEWRVVKSLPTVTISQSSPLSTLKNNNSWNFRKANWDKFTDDLDSYCSQIIDFNNLKILVQSFNRGVQKAAKLSIPRRKRRNDWMPYWKDHNIDALIHERDSACNDLEKNNNIENRRKFTDICREVEEEIAAYKREKWADFCGRLDLRKDSQHWNVIKVLNNRSTQVNNRPTSNIIVSNGHKSKTDLEAANLLATHYEQARKLSFQNSDKKQKKAYKQVLQQNKSYIYTERHLY
ncbi:reverse transcriptase domain-containing protein [Trichonephila inaurata madagascariensis]|uniref:Reverse transcriptase domain-containing protein n=1 Tax=Trichonephila inaurata madagascariensis TaxID=2747483 RepID=A0A8X6XWA5_9ARAC|nr:reverse transcriptase domain-containing protein [Trichonephila inaurata madagascariensis]